MSCRQHHQHLYEGRNFSVIFSGDADVLNHVPQKLLFRYSFPCVALNGPNCIPVKITRKTLDLPKAKTECRHLTHAHATRAIHFIHSVVSAGLWWLSSVQIPPMFRYITGKSTLNISFPKSQLYLYNAAVAFRS